MMESLIILVFIVGYLTITLEHTFKINKLIPALAMMAISWAMVALGNLDVFNVDTALRVLVPTHLEEIILHHLGKTAEILIFLIGAMTIVEIIDYFNGFSTIKGFIKTKNKTRLLWIFTGLAFVLSAIIDNLTATIVLISILRKIISRREDRIWYASLIIVSTNAGGAWSPIGDVTTTMLWIANKVTALQLMSHLLIPSIISVIIPVTIASFLPAFKGTLKDIEKEETKNENKYGAFMFYLGLGAIIFVPIFKTITHLPPYIGMMLSLAVVAIFAEILSQRKFALTTLNKESDKASHHSPIHTALQKIEMPSILFFLGILMAVAALESLGFLFGFANWLQVSIPMIGTELATSQVSDLVIILLGGASAVIDNVPLVAASIGMFPNQLDDPIWHFIAYAAGTGGSMLIIGSAAGVVAMGMEKIDFFWYLKNFTWMIFLGYIAGAFAFIGMRFLLS